TATGADRFQVPIRLHAVFLLPYQRMALLLCLFYNQLPLIYWVEVYILNRVLSPGVFWKFRSYIFLFYCWGNNNVFPDFPVRRSSYTVFSSKLKGINHP